MATPLGLSSYHRAQSLGDGAFGAVVAVYDDDGSQFALKSFDEAESDAEDESMDLGLIREVSALRLLMAPSLAHRGVMPLRDITVVGGVVSLVMPMYPMNIGKAIETKAVGSRPEKIRVAFELLSALAFLHDNGVIHRDIKPDNIMMDDGLSPVLIDFSLAKQLSPSELLTAATHSGNVGTACYISPECYASEPYAAECDSYSAGVVLLELFRGERLSCERDKAALALVQRLVSELPSNPFPDLLRGLLEPAGAARLTCRAALSEPLFAKNDLRPPPVSAGVAAALAWVHPAAADENAAPAPVGKKRAGAAKGPSEQQLSKCCGALGVERAQTVAAARAYAAASPSTPVQYCALLACKVYEEELMEFEDSEEAIEGAGIECEAGAYAEAELEVLRAMNFCLFVPVVEGGAEADEGSKRKKKKGKK
ncbi:hypothetical protein TeGR_g14549 [Tetraparma gracilis]|uniref:non-specific serine/threonine protein kinase n=1 Tax=Tetraparma gracilis TaxID=2962635 RepID=A0ABQ6N0S3_9STRA|nr:hypothetical protein TeGR_g14549 [Tetraparma gracilis]